MKPESRVLGVDDAPHTRADREVPLVGVVMRGSSYVEAVLTARATRDGDDATDRIVAMAEGYRGRDNLGAVLVHNLMVGGFNVLDLRRLHETIGLPVIAVAKGQPDLPAVREALLSGRIGNGDAKWRRIEAVEPLRRPIQDGKGTMVAAGMDGAEAEGWVAQWTVRGILPEPLRVAHLIGAGWMLGQSRGS